MNDKEKLEKIEKLINEYKYRELFETDMSLTDYFGGDGEAPFEVGEENGKIILSKKISEIIEDKPDSEKIIKLVLNEQPYKNWGNKRFFTIEIEKHKNVCSNEKCVNHTDETKGNFCSLCGSKITSCLKQFTTEAEAYVTSKDKFIIIEKDFKYITFKKYNVFIASFFPIEKRSPYLIYCSFEVNKKLKEFKMDWLRAEYGMGYEIKDLTFQIYKISVNKEEENRYYNLEDYELIETKTSYSSALKFCQEHVNKK